jgi:hypothetical protein
MLKTNNLLLIPTPLIDSTDFNAELYKKVLDNVLDKIIPYSLSSIQDKETCLEELRKLLPLVAISDVESAIIPFNLSFFLLCSFRANAFQFFFEFVTKWLIPGKRLNVELFYASDFKFEKLGEEVLTLAEVVVRIESKEDLSVLVQHLPVIETEIRLGITSGYHARRILETKGMNIDTKTSMIHDSIASLIKRGSGDVNWDILSEMQHFIVTLSDNFKNSRPYKHLSRLICFSYLFKRELKKSIKLERSKRFVFFRLIHTKLKVGTTFKPVLGILVGINFLQDHEFFEERHLLKSIGNILPQSKPVEGSFFTSFIPKDPFKILYIEIEKNEAFFSKDEIAKLKKNLATDLRGRVERLLHPIFMPRNEEEVMRNIVTLSNQIKYVRDIPQVILSFDEHTSTKISFTIILLRVLKQSSTIVAKLFENYNPSLEYIVDRTKIVGYLRNKYPKEALVFHVKLEKKNFLREDHSVDLYKARQFIVADLVERFGDVRDFNGGMISKQNELFQDVKELLGGIAKHHELLLENFFYSLMPVVMRSLLEPIILKKLFLFLLDVVEDGIDESQKYVLEFWQEEEGLFVIVMAKESSYQSILIKAVENLRDIGFDSARICVMVHDKHCLGFVYRGHDLEKQARFYEAIIDVMKCW